MIRVWLPPLCQMIPLPGASPFCNPCRVRLQAVDVSSSQFYNDIRLVEALSLLNDHPHDLRVIFGGLEVISPVPKG